MRDPAGEGKITILSLGPDSAHDVIKTGLAMGGDEGVLLNDRLSWTAIATRRPWR